MPEPIPELENRMSRIVVDAALADHRALGPGLLESVYEACLAEELRARRVNFRRQQPIPLVYRDIQLENVYQLDMIVEDVLIIELKAVETLHPVYEAQLLTYLKLTGKRLGLLINFNVSLLKDGIRRLAL